MKHIQKYQHVFSADGVVGTRVKELADCTEGLFFKIPFCGLFDLISIHSLLSLLGDLSDLRVVLSSSKNELAGKGWGTLR